ncbi:MAG TPA: glycosyltransferase family A protein [Chloroflexota bacterium]|nr:glycosyltransferase family A protein [Chloroflexota bacterium]
MEVSVVICTRNRPDLIGTAVASVLANTYPRFDVLVVDQSDDGRTGEIVRRLMAGDARLRYHHTSIAGLSRAYNIGVRETSGQILAFTDDDCVAPPDWVAQMVGAFAREPEVDLIYGQVLLPASLSETLASGVGTVPTLAFERPTRINRVEGFRLCGMGANFGVRRRLFERLGGFDEIMGGGGPLKSSQDFDFQYRAYLAGATVLLCPEVRVDHYGLRSNEEWPATLRAYGIGDGAFYWKHVRCGDVFAFSLLLRRLGRLVVREALNGIRRKPSHLVYLRSCLQGILESRRFAVDPQRRLYLAPSGAA